MPCRTSGPAVSHPARTHRRHLSLSGVRSSDARSTHRRVYFSTADTWGVFSSGREITTPDGKLDRRRVLVPDLRHEDTTAETGGEGGMNRRRGAAPPFGHVRPSPSTAMHCYVPPPVTTRPGVPRHTTSPASTSERLHAGSTVGSQPLARDQPVAAGDPRPAELTAPLGLRLAFSSSCPAKAAPAPRGAGTGGSKRRPS